MSPHSPVPIPRTPSALPHSNHPATFQSLYLTGTISLRTLFRVLITVFTFVAIILLIVGPSTVYRNYRGQDGQASILVTFPLIFLFLSFLSHITVAAHYRFTELVYVEWRRPDWRTQSDPLLHLIERLHSLEQPKARALAVADGGAGLGMGIGALLVAVFPRCSVEMVAGVVFTFLTAAMHILLAVMPEGGFRLTLTLYEGDQERKPREGLVQLAEEDLNGEPIDLKLMA
ncbi:hypothetical protein MMC18_003589 [Xylographa bjoerkii]|nr:hypothetical protein [Xylographa bjoerkii]